MVVLSAAEEPHWADVWQAYASAGTAVLTVAAVIVTGWLLIVDRKRLRAELTALQRDRADRDAAQARRVWAEVEHINYLDPSNPDAPAEIVWAVHNGSDAPIFDVTLTPIIDGKSVEVFPWHAVPSVVRGNTGAEPVTGSMRIEAMPDDTPDQNLRWPTLEMSMTDSTGLRWTRRGHDTPQRVTAP